ETVKDIPLLFPGNPPAVTFPAHMHVYINMLWEHRGSAAHEPPEKEENPPRQPHRTCGNERQRSPQRKRFRPGAGRVIEGSKIPEDKSRPAVREGHGLHGLAPRIEHRGLAWRSSNVQVTYLIARG